MDFTSYIQPELLVLVPVLVVLAEALKYPFEKYRNYIPLILTGAGVLMATMYTIGHYGVGLIPIFTAITQGIICAGMAVYGYEIVKGLKKH